MDWISEAMASSAVRGVENIELGRIEDVWKDENKWLEFKTFLADFDEGYDGRRRKLCIQRYGTFLELFVRLHVAETKADSTEDDLRNLVLSIGRHDEDFFGKQRRLKCVDGGMIEQVLLNVKAVERREKRGGKWVFQDVYAKVLDRLNLIYLPRYHEKFSLKLQTTATSSSSTTTTVTTTSKFS